jgi:hypothetical protein
VKDVSEYKSKIVESAHAGKEIAKRIIADDQLTANEKVNQIAQLRLPAARAA